jgi:hypothetical protein
MTAQETGPIAILVERWMGERAERPAQPVQDRLEPQRSPAKEPLSDDGERHDPPPLRT